LGRCSACERCGRLWCARRSPHAAAGGSRHRLHVASPEALRRSGLGHVPVGRHGPAPPLPLCALCRVARLPVRLLAWPEPARGHRPVSMRTVSAVCPRRGRHVDRTAAGSPLQAIRAAAPCRGGFSPPPRRRAAEESLREPAGLSSSPRQGRLGGKLADARSGAPLPDPATTPARRGVRRRSVWRGHSVSPCFWCPVRDAFRPSPVAVEDREPHDLRCAHRQCHHNDTGTPSGPMPKPLARHMGSAIRPGWGVRVPYAWIPVAVDHLRPLAHQVIP